MKLAASLALFFSSVSCCLASSGTSLFADGVGGYWSNFIKWWGNLIGSQSGVVLVAMAVGAASLFIITRGKWHK